MLVNFPPDYNLIYCLGLKHYQKKNIAVHDDIR